MASQLLISVVEGKEAPRYPEFVKEVELTNAIITTQGMESDRPLVDLVFKDKDGNSYYSMVSGKLIAMLGRETDKINLKGGHSPYLQDEIRMKK